MKQLIYNDYNGLLMQFASLADTTTNYWVSFNYHTDKMYIQKKTEKDLIKVLTMLVESDNVSEIITNYELYRG